jgi:hypothetical protein
VLANSSFIEVQPWFIPRTALFKRSDILFLVLVPVIGQAFFVRRGAVKNRCTVTYSDRGLGLTCSVMTRHRARHADPRVATDSPATSETAEFLRGLLRATVHNGETGINPVHFAANVPADLRITHVHEL